MGLAQTDSTLRDASGATCPRCRHAAGEPLGVRLVRCPNGCGTVLVARHALAECDGDPFLGVVVAGRYAILDLIGAGSMGTVYRARQEAMGRDVALKVVRADRLLDAQAKTRFQQEAHAMSLLTSPHTVTVFDFGEVAPSPDDPPEVAGALYLAMELLEGESVGERLKREGPIPLDEATAVVRHALASLAEAHDKGVIHRDLKPDNLLVTRGVDGKPHCKVLDFGIAKLLTSDGRVDVLETQAGTVFGTPRYMSPEQAQGKRLDARSDLYALGVILYHMLAGRAPFTDDDAVVVMAHHIKTLPPRPSEVAPSVRIPVRLEALVMRALDKDPSCRPQTAAEFLAALDEALVVTNDGSGALAAVTTEDVARPPRTLLLSAISVIALAAVVVAVLLARRATPPAPESPAALATPGAASATPSSAPPSDPVPAMASAQASATSATESALPSALPTAATSAATTAPRPATGIPKKRGYTKFDR